MITVPIDRLRGLATEMPTKSAITEAGVTITFRELYARCSAVAQGLRAEGVTVGERIIYLGRNSTAFFEVAFGCALVGAVLAPMNWRLTAEDIAELVADSGAELAFVERDFAGVVPEGIRTFVVGDTYEAWRNTHPRHDPGSEWDSEQEFIQFYTSGTTGLPKGVIVKNGNVAYLCRAGEHWQFDVDSVVVVAMPLFHMGGSAWGLVGLLAGAHCIVLPEFEPAAVVELLESERVTNILVAPTMLQMLVAVPGIGERDFSHMTAIAYGSAPISVQLLQRVLDVFNVPLIQLFGLTETTGAISQLDPQDHRIALLESVGRPYPWVELEIHDPDSGRPMGSGEVGEVWIRSPQCSDGYWNRPEETSALLTADGWLRTGDAGHLDAEGFLFLTDRIKEMIITGGENVYPAEVERVMVEHPAVQEVAVIGAPHEQWGEQVTAVVALRDGFEESAESLMEWARPRLAGFRRPRRIEFVEALPRNPTGKLLRREVRAAFWSQAGRRQI
ncbi:AMP-binding protein [Nocardia rhamnosiphila]|uniref:AMP-binding protein n=1 Tax=Nocardia rhamnosiphila TaxID=426716 RepID=A0ABV2WRA9_9NOCA